MRMPGLCAAALVAGLATASVNAGPLHEAAQRGDIVGTAELLAAGAEVEALDDTALTPLVIAALSGHKEVVALLLEGGADPRGRDGNGFTALHAAAHAGHLDIVEHLVSLGVEVNDQKNKARISPLHAAAERGFVDIARVLLAHGAALDLKAGQGHTPIKMATLNAHAEMVVLLREHGGDCLDFGPGRFREYCLSAGG